MHKNIALLITLSYLGLSSSGCDRRDKAPASREASSSARAASPKSTRLCLGSGGSSLGPGGSTGHNGVLPDVYHAHQKKITDSTGSVFSLGGGSALHDLLMDTDPQAEKLVEYTVDCALSGSFKLKSYDISVGASLLSTTGSWSSAALTDEQREDLHTCLATRVNPKGADVCIWMGGPHVVVDPAVDASEFPVEEAFWAAYMTSDGVTINVWPSPEVEEACRQSPSVKEAVMNRVCGTAASTCGFVPRSDHGLCKSFSDGYRCHRVAPVSPPSPPPVSPSDQPVIRTRLKCKDWCTFYPSCKLPAQCRTATGENDCKATLPGPS